jgi:hypothetical protein
MQIQPEHSNSGFPRFPNIAFHYIQENHIALLQSRQQHDPQHLDQ